jgi:hypothetical protein
MSACCHAGRDRKTPMRVGKARTALAWILPSVLLVLLPKCPACVAAYVLLWTGLGLSLSVAAGLRYGLLFLCVASLLFLIVNRLYRVARARGFW